MARRPRARMAHRMQRENAEEGMDLPSEASRGVAGTLI